MDRQLYYRIEVCLIEQEGIEEFVCYEKIMIWVSARYGWVYNCTLYCFVQGLHKISACQIFTIFGRVGICPGNVKHIVCVGGGLSSCNPHSKIAPDMTIQMEWNFKPHSKNGSRKSYFSVKVGIGRGSDLVRFPNPLAIGHSSQLGNLHKCDETHNT